MISPEQIESFEVEMAEMLGKEATVFLPSWEELEAQSQWARQQGIALPPDGARLWQCTPHCGRSLAEITALFDSVYVSFFVE